MTGEHAAQLGAALLATATPLVVAAIVYRVAQAHAGTLGHRISPPSSFRYLTITTVGVAAVAGVIAALLPAPTPWMLLVGPLAFAIAAIPGLHVLSRIDAASLPAREVTSSSRTARLTPRRASRYLHWSWRVVPYLITGAGIAVLLLRISSPLAHRQLLVPLVFAFAATMFVLLYESWIQNVVAGPVVNDDADRHGLMVRRIFTAELVLVVTALAVAHAVLDLNWTTDGATAAWLCFAGGAVGIAGCALALASGLTGRKYVVPGNS